MTFPERLAAAQTAVEVALSDLLAANHARGMPDRLARAMRHAVLGGGKRLRPFLVIESARLCGIRGMGALPAACAVELIHCYSLVHDDLPDMDNDRLRRGQPTVWAAFDAWTAILAGDALQALAFEVVSTADTHRDPHVRCELVAALAAASGPTGMVGGQAIDLEADKLGQPATPDLGHIRRLHAMKTGALIAFAAEAGSILGQADPVRRRALRTFGEHLGFAFQIADDLLDVEGSEAEVGKAVAKDASAGKATIVSLLGITAARAALADATTAAIDALEPFGAEAFVLRATAEFVASRKS
ncbi:MAG: polyprenyl synthetase family protein [Hyphomicrobiaceae bacterium]|nr:polyprenyl synthetase family protein [Hyphomicrobiaceae bacterium]